MPKRRFPMIPVVAWILRVLAILMLAFLLTFAITGLVSVFGQFGGQVQGFSQYMQLIFSQFVLPLILTLLLAFVVPTLLWAAADGLLALREIEFNTRRDVVQPAAATTVIPSAPVQETPRTDEDTPTA